MNKRGDTKQYQEMKLPASGRGMRLAEIEEKLVMDHFVCKKQRSKGSESKV